MGVKTPRPVRNLEGQVAQAPLASGSKSARLALWLETPEGRFALRRKDGPTWGDDTLNQYLGHRVTCDGFVVDYQLLVERICVID